MTMTMRILVLATVLAALPAASAHAAPATVKPGLRVAPAAPTRTSTITVAFRAPAKGRYGATVTIRPGSRTRLACSYGASAPAVGATGPITRAGARRTIVLKPAGSSERPPKWCPGPATVTVRRFPANSGAPTIVAARRFRVWIGRGETAPGPADTRAAVRLLADSTVTLSSAGRPDRSTPVNGVFRGLIPSPFAQGEDISITRAGGSLIPVGLTTAPTCPGPAPIRSLDLRAGTGMTLAASGKVTLTLVLNGTPAELTGCGAPRPAAGTTTVTLTGQTGEKGLLALTLDGAADGVALHLLVNVDLSGRL